MKGKFSDLEVLDEVFDVLEGSNIFYWLIDGTALKAYRDGKFSKSTDIDLALWSQDITSVLDVCQVLKRSGFGIIYQNYLHVLEDHIIVIPPKGKKCQFELISFHFFSKFNNEAIMRNISHPFRMSTTSLKTFSLINKFFSVKSNRILSSIPFIIRKLLFRFVFYFYQNTSTTYWYVIPLRFFKNMSTINLYGREFYIPSNIEQYLKFRYGDDWKVPMKSWVLSDCMHTRIRKIGLSRNIRQYYVNPDKLNFTCKNCIDVFNYTNEEICKIKELDLMRHKE